MVLGKKKGGRDKGITGHERKHQITHNDGSIDRVLAEGILLVTVKAKKPSTEEVLQDWQRIWMVKQRRPNQAT